MYAIRSYYVEVAVVCSSVVLSHAVTNNASNKTKMIANVFFIRFLLLLLELNKVINEPQSYVHSLVNRLRKRLYQLFFDLSRIFRNNFV